MSIFYLGAALIQVPYTAWTADLTKDYGARTRLAGYSQFAILIGTLVALFTLALFDGEVGQQLYWLSWLATAAVFGTVFPAILLVREPRPLPPSHQGGIFDAFVLLRQIPELRRFAFAYALNSLGNTLPLTLTLFYFDFVLDLKATFLLVYFLSALAFIPLWTYLGNRYGRHRMWRLAILSTTVLQAPAALLSPETAWVFIPISLIVGAFLCCRLYPAPGHAGRFKRCGRRPPSG